MEIGNYGSHMRVVITGANGMLAHALAEAFDDVDEIYLWDRSDLDITDRATVLHAIEGIEPDVIINAAAYTAVDDAEENEELATQINGAAVANLAEAARRVGAKLVHFSTDYVFAGDRKEGYDESFDGYDPVNAYGRSKLAGEQALAASGADTYVVRTSWLYGPGGKNFVETMLWLARKVKDPDDDLNELKVIADQYGKPTYTKDLAEATRELVQGAFDPGVYHVSNEADGGSITWHDFASEIFRQAGYDVVPLAIPTKEYPTPAKRPEYSTLLNTKLPPRRDWKDALAEYLVHREDESDE